MKRQIFSKSSLKRWHKLETKRIKGEFIYALPVCACMCVTCMKVHVHVHVHVEAISWHLSQSFSSLFAKTGTFAEPRAHRLDEVS